MEVAHGRPPPVCAAPLVILTGPADELDHGPALVGHHPPTVVLLLVHPAVAVKGAADFIRLHQGDARKAHPRRRPGG
jgi:hypothetical protein